MRLCCDLQENGPLQKKIQLFAQKCPEKLWKSSMKRNLYMNEILSGMYLTFEIIFVNNRVGKKALKWKQGIIF
jgi:hypothetical protein